SGCVERGNRLALMLEVLDLREALLGCAGRQARLGEVLASLALDLVAAAGADDHATTRTIGKIAPTTYSTGRAVAQVMTIWVGAFWSESLPGVFGTSVAVAAPVAVTLYCCSLMFAMSVLRVHDLEEAADVSNRLLVVGMVLVPVRTLEV